MPHQLPISYTGQAAFSCSYKNYFKKANIAIYKKGPEMDILIYNVKVKVLP
jgi:hypothetical protein